MNVLIVENNPEIAEIVSFCLLLRWPTTNITVAREGQQAIDIQKKNLSDLTLLDLNLPDIDGFLVLQQVRSFSENPIIILTSRSEEKDRVHALEMGADDYITKPFRPRELLARIHAVLRGYEQGRKKRKIAI